MNIQSALRNNGIKSLWHFTDKSNLTSIEEYGLMCLREILTKDVHVSCYGADSISHSLDRNSGLDQFVHLAFVNDHPMYHIAKRDGRIINPVWIEIDLSVLHENNTIFSDEVANKRGASIFRVDKLESILDFKALLYPRDFDTKIRVRKAEIMVANNISFNNIKGIYYGN
jgi:hypothetical protein